MKILYNRVKRDCRKPSRVGKITIYIRLVMLVSNFELLVKRIAPLTSIPAVNAPFRRVIQGYFLTVTNLDPNRATSFFLSFTIPTIGGSAVPSEKEFVLTPPANINVECLVDLPTGDNVSLQVYSGVSNGNYKKFTTRAFSVGPLQTVLVTLLPFIRGNASLIPASRLEIRGFVELFQQATFFRSRPPIDVLITPEARGTFLDDDYPNFGTPQELDFDQISYGYPTFSGGSMNTVEAAPRIPFPQIDPQDVVQQLPPLTPAVPVPFPKLSEETFASLQAEMLEMGYKIETVKNK